MDVVFKIIKTRQWGLWNEMAQWQSTCSKREELSWNFQEPVHACNPSTLERQRQEHPWSMLSNWCNQACDLQVVPKTKVESHWGRHIDLWPSTSHAHMCPPTHPHIYTQNKSSEQNRHCTSWLFTNFMTDLQTKLPKSSKNWGTCAQFYLPVVTFGSCWPVCSLNSGMLGTWDPC